MKKLIFIAMSISLLSMAAISTKYVYRPTENKPVFVLLDSTKIYDLTAVRKFKITPAAMAEAARLYQLGLDSENTNAAYSVPFFLQALRTCPVAHIYERYANTLRYTGDHEAETEPTKGAIMLSDTLRGAISTAQFIAGAKYALAHNDTSAVVSLLMWCMEDDTIGYRAVNKDEAFRPLENYPGYYYMMDNYLHEDEGQQSTLRTMRYTKAADLPYAMTTQTLVKTYEYKLDSASGNYISPYSLQDDAMRDLVRGNRYGRFSRETDHGVQYEATLHLSKDFYTYIYRTDDGVNRGLRSMKMIEEPIIEIDSEATALEKTPPPPAKAEGEDDDRYDAPVSYYLVNVDKYGKKIAEQQIGCACSPIHISLASVDKNGLIEVREMEQIWRKDPLVSGYKNNEVVSTEPKGVKHYKVKGDGSIVALIESATAKN